MGAILSLVSVIFGVLLYDYFTARKWQQVTSGIRNNIVFEHRNKEYGAYALRRDYDKRMVFILLGVVLTIGVLFGTYQFVKNMSEEEIVSTPPVDTTQFTIETSKEEITPPLPPKKEEVIQKIEKTTAFIPPVVTDDPIKDIPPIQDKLEGVTVGNKIINKDDGEWGTVPDDGSQQGTKLIEHVEDPILEYVEEDAQFLGGYAALNAFIVKKIIYPETPLQLGIQGKCYVAFTVNKDGSIENVRIEGGRGVPDCPECDREAIRVVKSMPHWKPAKHNGKVVRSTCRLPINFTLN